MEPNEASPVPGDGSAQSVLRSCGLSGPRASADPASPRCRACRSPQGAPGRRSSGHISSSPFPGPRLSRLSEEKLGLDPGTGRKRQPNCSSRSLLGEGGSAFRNFSHFSRVSVFWCLQYLQRFAYFDSSGVRAVLGSTRRYMRALPSLTSN